MKIFATFQINSKRESQVVQLIWPFCEDTTGTPNIDMGQNSFPKRGEKAIRGTNSTVRVTGRLISGSISPAHFLRTVSQIRMRNVELFRLIRNNEGIDSQPEGPVHVTPNSSQGSKNFNNLGTLRKLATSPAQLLVVDNILLHV